LHAAVEEQDFPKAAQLRDAIRALVYAQPHANMTEAAGSLAPKWATPEYYAEMDVAYLLQDLHRQIDNVQAVSAPPPQCTSTHIRYFLPERGTSRARSVVADASSAAARHLG